MGAEVVKLLSKLDTSLNGVWDCENETMARELEVNIGSMVEVLIDEAFRLAEQWNMPDEFEAILSDVTKAVGQYK